MPPSPPLVLVIDDEAAIRDGCRQTLEKSGYAVSEAADGREGIRIARETHPDIALIDLKLPGISGMEIIEILSRDLPDTVLIMITGYATIGSAVEAIQKGTYDYLPKPFNPGQLRAVVRRANEHRQLKIEARRLREEKERMEKSFITFVSHEMRSPLVVVRQYLEALKAVAGDCFNRETADIVERCSDRIRELEAMIEHWLDLSRIGEGSLVGRKRPVDLIEILLRSAWEMAPLCNAQGLKMETDLPETLPSMEGDAESLLRVLTNLIGNATQYTPARGTIRLRAGSDGDRITVEVADTGEGIPADKLPFIFEPFYRVKGKEERQRGSGLGLTYCRRIMELHGGEITASSVEGQGSTFLLKFPVPGPPGQRTEGVKTPPVREG
jgi:signal transduction histidine kinase